MLVLSRKQSQRIVIDDDIVITVVKSHGPVKLGIDAPDDVEVLREELLDTEVEPCSAHTAG